MNEHIRNLVDMILDTDPDYEYSIEGLSDAILKDTGEYIHVNKSMVVSRIWITNFTNIHEIHQRFHTIIKG